MFTQHISSKLIKISLFLHSFSLTTNKQATKSNQTPTNPKPTNQALTHSSTRHAWRLKGIISFHLISLPHQSAPWVSYKKTNEIPPSIPPTPFIIRLYNIYNPRTVHTVQQNTLVEWGMMNEWMKHKPAQGNKNMSASCAIGTKIKAKDSRK